MAKTRIAIIGAGSVAWSMTFVRDLAVTKGLWGSEVVLMDINEERLGITASLAKRYTKEVGADIKFKTTTNRKEAIEGSDFVVNTAFTVGYTNMEKERRIAEEYGYYRGIGDRVCDYYGNIGAYKQLKFFLEVAHDIEELSPDAWYIILANPVFEGTTLVSRESKVKVVGMCHGWLGYKAIAKTLGLDLKYVEADMAGTNHNVWLVKFTYKGEDVYPLIDKWIEEKAEEYWQSSEYLNALPWESEQMSPAAVEMYRLYGLFPLGDTIRAVSPWWFHTDLNTKRKWYGPTGGFDSEVGWAIYLSLHNMLLRRMYALAKNPKASLLQELPPERSDEQIIPFINAVVNDEETRVVINVPNKGAISGIGDDVAVEVPVMVSARGYKHVFSSLELPRRLMLHVMIPRVLRMERILQAFLDGDRKSLVLTLMDDHRTESFEQAKNLVEKLLSLPWNVDANEHYKWN